MPKKARFATTLRSLAKHLGIAERTIYNYSADLKNPKKGVVSKAKGKTRYDIEAAKALIWENDGRRKKPYQGGRTTDEAPGSALAGKKAADFGGQVLEGVGGESDPPVDDGASQPEPPSKQEQLKLGILDSHATKQAQLARQAELKTAELEGRMIDVEDAQRALANRYAEAVRTCDNVAKIVPDRIMGLDKRDMIIELRRIYRKLVWEVFSRSDDVYPEGIPADERLLDDE